MYNFGRCAFSRHGWFAALAVGLLFGISFTLPAAARDKEKVSYGEGLIVNIPVPESEVEQVVQDVVQNGVIRGTKEYNKDEFVSGAVAASTSHVFPAWTEGGKVFYKVREHALDPRNFKDSTDTGTLAVRYVVLAQGANNTVLRIDALFEEEFRHAIHPSSGAVESAEYKDIKDHIDSIEVMKQQDAEAEKERQEQLAKRRNYVLPADSTSAAAQSSQLAEVPADSNLRVVLPQPPQQSAGSESLSASTATPQSLEEHVKDMRRQVERLVKAPGAPLKSAPFHTASTLQTLKTGTEILILISTPYWYGVETHGGQHGWIMRDELEQPQ
jgi:hypothetical protein